jgi:hypothetical protein
VVFETQYEVSIQARSALVPLEREHMLSAFQDDPEDTEEAQIIFLRTFINPREW